MKAVILAGGKGTRLNNLTNVIPKPMLKIGDKPLLEHQIELLKRYDIQEIYILVNHLKDVIIDYFGDGKDFGVSITYYEEKEPLGTVGGLKEIEDFLDTDFVVLYGDVMINMDINRLLKFHFDHNSHCTLVLHPNNHPFDSDLVEIDDKFRVTGFLPKPHPQNLYYRNLVNAGAYVMNPVMFDYIEKGVKADFGKDIFPQIFPEIRMYGYNTAEYLKDMGTPSRLKEVNDDFLTGKTEAYSYANKRKAVFMDRDGVINIEKSFISKPEDMILYDFTAEAIKKLNDAGFLTIVVTNQSVIARNLCDFEQLETIHKKLETDLGKVGAKLDRIYYCPHHPDKGYPEENAEYKIDCECRKPKIGMFRQALEDFNIDVENSYMIGDSERDIIFGINSGLKTIGVKTGYALEKSKVSPDYLFEDLAKAVDFIVNI
ncbi:MAG: HAD-IIIA family hydrolase [Bacteroidota bacterium]|nr:HAD-IIIA family hydrolase [Bacteroidota bacterium]